MKRLLLLILAGGGAAFWWRRRSAAQTGPDSISTAAPDVTPSADASPPTVDEPPPLGGDVDPELLEILACPVDKQPVAREGDYLVCAECRRHYPIRDGIPVMLVDEALQPEQVAAG